MTLKLKTVYLFLIPVLFQSCLDMGQENVGPIIEPPQMILLKKDSLISGKHYGVTIGQPSSAAYPGMQDLHDSLEVSYLNLVSNFVTDFRHLEERLPLYSYMTFDEMTGTSNGVQLWFEDKKLKSIYLNSGKRLGQWPENISAAEAVREGESSEITAGKLKVLQKDSRYSYRFERSMLGVKTLTEAYDPGMEGLPQWYFGYKVDEKHTNYVYVYFRDDKVDYIIVHHMKTL
ncbi:MAG: hypothetical protein LRY55_09825 [Leadbetterella sp.]|nr:hypothetical protein [Leadbetterella sp.]